MKMHQTLKSNQPTKRRKKCNRTFRYRVRVNFFVLLVHQLLNENKALSKLLGKHFSLDLQAYSLEEHIKILEENLHWSKLFLGNPVMQNLFNMMNSESCKTCKIIKENIHKVQQLSSCLIFNGMKKAPENPSSDFGPSSSTETCGVSSSNPEISPDISFDTFISAAESLHENSGTPQKRSNIYPPKYVRFLEENLRKQINLIQKSSCVNEKHLKVFTANQSRKPSSDSLSRIENNLVNDYQRAKPNNLNTLEYKAKGFHIRFASSLSMRDHDDSAFVSEFRSPVLLENQDNASFKAATATNKTILQGCNSKEQLINATSTKSKNYVSCSSEVNKRRKLAASTKVLSSSCIEKDSRSRKKAVSQICSVRKCFGPAEISVMKKSPKWQPFVKLDNLYKDKCNPVAPRENEPNCEAVDNFSVTDKFCRKYKKAPYVPSRHSISSHETNEDMNLILQTESVNEHVMRENYSYRIIEAEHCSDKTTEMNHCLGMTMEVEHCVDKTMEVQHCSDKTKEVEHCSDTTMEVEHCSDKAMDAEHSSDKTMDAERFSDETLEAEFCSGKTSVIELYADKTMGADYTNKLIEKALYSDKTMDIETERNDLSSFQVKTNSEQIIREIQECSCTKEFNSHEREKTVGAKLKRNEFFVAKNNLDSSTEKEEFGEKNKNEGAETVLEVSKLNQLERLDTDKNSSLSSDLSFNRGPRTPSPPSSPDHSLIICPKTPSPPPFPELHFIRGPRTPRTPSPHFSPFRPISPKFSDDETDVMCTPRSPPTPEKHPSTTDFPWASSPQLWRRGPRTPPGPLPRSPEASDDDL